MPIALDLQKGSKSVRVIALYSIMKIFIFMIVKCQITHTCLFFGSKHWQILTLKGLLQVLYRAQYHRHIHTSVAYITWMKKTLVYNKNPLFVKWSIGLFNNREWYRFRFCKVNNVVFLCRIVLISPFRREKSVDISHQLTNGTLTHE